MLDGMYKPSDIRRDGLLKIGKLRERDAVITPLNGLKTHPLTAHAKGVLRDLSERPIPTQDINAGVVNRLMRGGLARIVMRPSPFKTHRGSDITHLEITPDGLTALKEPPQ